MNAVHRKFLGLFLLLGLYVPAQDISFDDGLLAEEFGEEDTGLVGIYKKYVEMSGYYEFQGANHIDRLDRFLKLNNIVDFRVQVMPREDFALFFNFRRFGKAFSDQGETFVVYTKVIIHFFPERKSINPI